MCIIFTIIISIIINIIIIIIIIIITITIISIDVSINGSLGLGGGQVSTRELASKSKFQFSIIDFKHDQLGKYASSNFSVDLSHYHTDDFSISMSDWEYVLTSPSVCTISTARLAHFSMTASTLLPEATLAGPGNVG